MPRRLLTLVAAGAMTLAFGGCRSDTVRVAYRPEVGDRSVYEITVRSTSVVEMPGEEEREEREEVVLEAEHVVLDAGRGGSRVRVRLRPVGGDDGDVRTFVVRLDEAARLAEVEEVEGLPAKVLGDVGLAEIFPAAGAAPDRPIEPGERWTVDEPVNLPGAGAARRSGRGRLASIGVVDGMDLAVIETEMTVPVATRSDSDDGPFRLDGDQRSESRTAYEIGDGSLLWAKSRTVGNFRLTLAADPREPQPRTGTLRVTVESETRRVS